MIARYFRCWTKVADADAYQDVLETKVIPTLWDIDGYEGGYVLRSDGPDEVEFVEVHFFTSIDAIKRFAGQEYTVPVMSAAAEPLISRTDPVARHYDVVHHRIAAVEIDDVPGDDREDGV